MPVPADLAAILTNYRLLSRSTTGAPFDAVTSSSVPITPVLTEGGRLSFTLPDAQLRDGYYTLGISNSTVVDNPPTADLNYVREKTALVAGFTQPQDLDNQIIEKVAEQTTYFDGLGRPVQQVQKQASPEKLDIATPTQYDPLGLETHKFLPYVAGNTGNYKANALTPEANSGLNPTPQARFYQGLAGKNDDQPFAETLFEASPLNRPLEQGAPGIPWQIVVRDGQEINTNHTVKVRQAARQYPGR